MTNTQSQFVTSKPSRKMSWLQVSLSMAMYACAAMLATGGAANAGVDVTKITRGDVSFSQDGNRLVVRASNGSIIEYNRFSIEAGQIMQFIQPSSTSRVLNRVTGSELSRIDGSLLSNGIVYLVNPQGFRIGNGALINVGGFYAAAGAMSDNDFARGKDNFTNLTGKITNEGMIHAKSVALVGQYVANRGTIDVDDGVVAMAAGDTVYLQHGSSPIMVTVSRSKLGADGSGAGTEAGVSNTGTIKAGKGRVSMGSGDFYATAMDLSGTIIGKSIEARGGKGGVVAVSGTLDASSATGKGGQIDVFGDRVGLFGKANVNANGATGGGSVRIGGDYLGSNAANAPQANRTVIGTDARITANATNKGDGGRVIVWSNEYTGFFGSIEASGAGAANSAGKGAGNGGFIETSSHDNLQAFGRVDAKAALGGKGGTWLLDPANLTISAAANTANGDGSGATPFEPNADGSVLNSTVLRDALVSGNVTIQTLNTIGTAAETGTVTFADWLTPTLPAATTLTVNAVGNIVVNSGVTINANTSALNVVFNAAGTAAGSTGLVQLDGSIVTNGGTLSINAAGAVTVNNAITTGLGNLLIVAGTGGLSGEVTQGGLSVLTIGGTTNVSTGAFEINLVGAGVAGQIPNPLAVANDFSGAVSLVNSGVLNDVVITSKNNLEFNTSTAGRDFTVNTGGSVTFNSGQVITVGRNCAVTASITSGAPIEQADATSTIIVGGTSNFTTGAALINLIGANNDFSGAVTLLNTGGFDVAITDVNALTLGTVTIGRDLTALSNGALNLGSGTIGGALTADSRNGGAGASGAITQSGALTVTGISTISASSNAITLTQANNDFVGAVTLTNSDTFDVAIRDRNTLTLGTVTIGTGGTGGLTANSNGALNLGTGSVGGNLIADSTVVGGPGAITQSGALIIGGTARFTAGAAAITLTSNNDFNGVVTLSNNGPNAVSIINGAGNGLLTLGTVGTATISTGAFTARADTIVLTGAINMGSLDIQAGLTSLTIDPGATIAASGNVVLSSVTDLTTSATITTTLAGTVTMTSSTGSLFLNPGANITANGAVTLTGAAGITTSATVTTTGIGSVAMTSSSGSLTLITGANITANGAVTLNGRDGITTDGAITTSVGSGGNVTLGSTAGALILTLNADITSNGDTSLTGSSGIFTAGNVTTSIPLVGQTNAVTYNSATELTGPITINTSVGLGNITFASTLDGLQNLTLIAGTGSIFLNGAVGSLAPLNAITINSATDVTAQAINASSLLQLAGTGETTFNGAQVYSAVAGLNVSTTSITLNNTVDTLAAGVSGIVTLTASNTLIITDAGDITSDGNVNLTGSGATFTAGNVTTTADPVKYFSNTILTGDVVIVTDGGNINFAGTLNGDSSAGLSPNLSMTAGTGDITFSENVGIGFSLGTVTVTSARTTNMVKQFTAATLALVAPGTTTVSGILTLSTALTVAAGAYNVSILGLSLGLKNSVAGATVFNNTGTLTIGNPGASGTISEFTGGITATAPSSVRLNGTITTLGATAMNFGALAAAVVLQSKTNLNSNGGAITLGGTLNSDAVITPRDLTISAGLGDIVFAGAVGTIAPLGAIVINSAGNVTAASIIAASFKQETGTGTTSFSGNQAYSTAAGFYVKSGAIVLTGNVAINTSVGGGLIHFDSTLDGATPGFENLALTAGTGVITFTGNVGEINALGIVTVNSAGSTNANGALFSAATLALVAPGNTTINGNLTLTTGLSAAAGAYNVSLLGLTNSVAGATVLSNTGTLTIGTNGTSVSTFTDSLTATAPSQITLNGTVNSNGSLNFANAGLANALGSTVTLNADAERNGLGTVLLGVMNGQNNSLSISAAGLVLNGNLSNIAVLQIQNSVQDGAITLMGIGGVAFETQLEWNRIQPTVSSVLLGNPAAGTGNTGDITVASGWINDSNVTMNFAPGGGGDFNVIGAITGSGILTVNGSGNTTNLGADITQAGITINDVVVVRGGGTLTLTATGLNGITINDGGLIAGISADAPGTDLVLQASGSGAGAPISLTGTFTDSGGAFVNNLTLGGLIVDAGTVTLSTTGVSAIIGNLSINNASGINLNTSGTTFTTSSVFMGENTTLTGNTSFVSTGGNIDFGTILAPVTIDGPFNLTVSAFGDVNFTGAIGEGTPLTDLSATSASNIFLAANVTARNVSFTTDTTLMDDVVIDTGTGSGDITFGGQLNSDNILTPHSIELAAGAGNITFTGQVGATALNVVTITSATNVTAGNGVTQNSFTADTLGLVNVLGTATFTGALTLNTLVVPDTVNNLLSTGNGTIIVNAVAFENAGLLTLGQSVVGVQTYTNGFDTSAVGGVVTLNGTFVTTNAAINLGDITLGSTTILATSVAGTIDLGAVTGGGFDLTLTDATNVNGTSVSNVGILSLANITGTATFTGAVSAVTLLVPATVNNLASIGSISIGSGGTINDLVTFLNSGTLALGQTGGTQTYTNGFNTSGVGGTVTLKGTFITGSNAPVILGDITLTENLAFSVDGLFEVGNVDADPVSPGFELSIAARDVDLNGTLKDLTKLTIKNFVVSDNITLLGAAIPGTLNISQAEWSRIENVDLVVLGDRDPVTGATGGILVNASWTNDKNVNIDFQVGGTGHLDVDNAIFGTGTLTVNGSGNTTNINSNITQNSITIFDAVQVQGGVTRTLTSQASDGVIIDSTGFVNGISSNTLNTTNLVMQTFVAGAPISLTGTFTTNGGFALHNLTMGEAVAADAGQVTFNASGTISGALLLVSPVVGINLQTNGLTMTANSITTGSASATTLLGVTTLATSGGQISFGGTLNGAENNLTIDAGTGAGTGATTFVGALTNLGTGTGAAITLNTASLVDFQSTITSSVQGSSGIVSTDSAGSTRFGGNVELSQGDTGSTFAGSVNFDGGVSWSGFDGLTVTGAATILNGELSLNSNGGAILFGSTLDGGSQNLVISSGTGVGTTTFQGALTNMGTGAGFAITLASEGLVDFQSTVSGFGGIDSSLLSGSTKFSGNVDLTSSGTGSTLNGSVEFAGINWTGFDGLTVNGAVTLSSAPVTIISNNGDITFGSTLDSDSILTPRDLTLTAGIGNILFTGLIGGTPLGVLTITSAGNVTVNGVGDNTLGGLLVTNTGIFTTGFGANLVVGGDLSLNGSASFGGNITTSGRIAFASDVTLTNNVTMTSGGGFGNDIVFGGILDSDAILTPRDLTLIAGDANIEFLDTVGSNFELGAITINSAFDVTANSTIKAAYLQQVIGTGTTTFLDAQTYSAVEGLNVNTDTIVLSSTVDTATAATGGIVTLTADGAGGGFGTLTIDAGANIASDGVVNLTGANGIQTGGNITSVGAVNFNSATTLSNDVTVTAGGLIGADINFVGTLDGLGLPVSTLTLETGLGNITFQENVGLTSPLLAITITDAIDVNFVKTVALDSFTQNQGTQVTSFADLVTITNAFAFTGNNLELKGLGDNTVGTTMTVANDGIFTTVDGVNITAADGFTQSGIGDNVIGGNISSANAGIAFASAVGLTNSAGVTMTSGGGVGDDIAFGGTLDSGVGTPPLTLDAGADGNITFTGAVGSLNPLGDIAITNANDVTASSTFIAANFLQLAGTGSTTFNDLVEFTGGFDFIGTNLTFNGVGDNSVALAMTVNNSGVFTTSNGGLAPSGANLGVGENFSQIGVAGTNSLGGNITSTTGGIAFSNDVELTNNVTMTSGGIVGNDIVFGGAIEGDGAAPRDLSLTAGDADINLVGIVGGNIPLGAITINSATNFTASEINAASLLQIIGSGTTTFNGAQVYTDAAGLNVTANAIVLNGLTIDTSTGDGVVTFNGPTQLNDALTITRGTGAVTFGITLDSEVSENNTLEINGATGGDITFTGAVGGGPSTQLGAITIASAANVDAQSTITAASFTQIDGTGITIFRDAQTYSAVEGLNVNTDTIELSSTVDTATAVTGGIVTLTADGAGGGLGTLTIVSGANIASDGEVNLTGANGIQTGGNITSVGTVNFNSATTLTNDVAVAAGGLIGADINFVGTLDGIGLPVSTLTLETGLGNITFQENVGLAGPLLAITITDAVDVNFAKTVALDSFTQNFGSGTTTFGDLITLEGAFNFTGNNLTMNGTGDSAVGVAGSLAAMNVTNSGAFTTGTGLSLVVDGSFTQSSGDAASTNSLGGNITSTNEAITFASAVTLTDNVTVTSGGGLADDIGFASTIDGAFDLTVNAGTGVSGTAGDVVFGGVIGGNDPLLSLTVTAADLTTRFSGDVTTIRVQTYNGGVQLDTDVVFTATGILGDINFNGQVTTLTGVENMTVLAGGSVNFAGTLGGTLGSINQIGNLTVDCGSIPGGTITFADTVATVTALSVRLNTNTILATPATVATIVSGGNIEFFTTDFAMGNNHKLTTLGGIRIAGLSGGNAATATLSDINAVGNLRVNANSITVLAHAAGPIVTNTGGTVNDPGVDFVVGGQVFFSSTPVMSGAGISAVFSNPTGNVDGSGTLASYAKTFYPTTITAALLTGTGGEILDLSAASGVSYGNPATMIPQAMASLPPLGLLGSADTLDSDESDESADLKPKMATKTGKKPAATKAKKAASNKKPAATGAVPVALR